MGADSTVALSNRTGKFLSGPIEIFYRIFGQPGRTPLVIVHGLSYFSYDWVSIASRLATERAVAAMDMRGFGDSGWAQDYSVPAFAGDIIGLLDHLGWRDTILIGHSMGARNCVWCAAENPNRIAALVLVDWSPENDPRGARRVAQTVAGTPDSFPTIEDAMRFFKVDPGSKAGASQRDRFAAYLRKTPAGFVIKRDPYFRDQFRRAIETGTRPSIGVDLWQALGKISCPTLAIRGSSSDMFAAGTIPRMLNANKHIKLVELNTGHNVAGDDPDGFMSAVGEFITDRGA